MISEAEYRRMEQNLHSANQERDLAVLTFQSKLASGMRHLFADLGDAFPGEKFANVEEEVLMTRLRQTRAALRAAGVNV